MADKHWYVVRAIGGQEKKVCTYIENEISRFIDYCYQNKVKKITIITGKGMRSKNLDDPYQSSDLSILKHSVPEYIKNNSELMKKIIRVDFESVNSASKGSFDIFLKTIK